MSKSSKSQLLYEANMNLQKAGAEITRLELYVVKIEKGLQQAGQHDGMCGRLWGGPLDCTCGLDDVIEKD